MSDDVYMYLQLSRCDPASTIHLISGTPLIKAVTNFTQVTLTDITLYIIVCSLIVFKTTHAKQCT